MPGQQRDTKRKLVVVAAGGTGGHLFPAQALAEALVQRDFIVHLMTDERVRDYGKNFPAREVHQISSATLSISKPHRWPLSAWRLWRGYRQALDTLVLLRPLAVAGFGGYPSLPPVLAATRLNIPSCIHEQNAIMGRANRALAARVDAVASSFPAIANLPRRAREKLRVTGNPVRNVVIEQRSVEYKLPKANAAFRLVIFGGSQGARFFAEFMPKALEVLPRAVRRTLRVVQQCRPEDIEEVRAAYAAIDLDCELAPFFQDMPKRMANAHLVICRSGASTIAELGVIGRPAILVPLPHSIDNDQLRNAESFAAAGAGWLKPQAALSSEEFAQFLTHLRYDESTLMRAALAARAQGQPDAAQKLAELIDEIAAGTKQTETTKP
jgi:UDP-N-acetylglucosamine--N-acetylmuramyl-(pentapeptide) pyrophosphoryl-undecaprenol N-acetylglucosamine transferase